MMRAAWAIPLVALCSCRQPSPDALAAQKTEQRYALMMRNRATPAELCPAAREAADAWSRALNDQKYSEWHARANYVCENQGRLINTL